MSKPFGQIIISIIRWTARIMGVLLAAFFLLFLFGYGVPKPSDLTTREMWMFFFKFLEISSLLIAWRYEAIGASIALAGYLLFSLFEGSFWVPPIFPLFPFVAVLFLICAIHSRMLKKSSANASAG